MTRFSEVFRCSHIFQATRLNPDAAAGESGLYPNEFRVRKYYEISILLSSVFRGIVEPRAVADFRQIATSSKLGALTVDSAPVRATNFNRSDNRK
jgi:hypothetical protein